jgi:hypothetical protein
MDCELVPSGFHSLYLQKDGLEFMTPIVFEDGMDFVECELYYASINSQETGGGFHGSMGLKERPPCLRQVEHFHSKLISCLKKPKRSMGQKVVSKRRLRRCSFGGLPKFEESIEASAALPRANSTRSFIQHKPRVAFEEYVQVVTIHPIDSLPLDVRSQMWMSRQEMLQGMRRAAMEERERQACIASVKEELGAFGPCDDMLAASSIDTVIAECIYNATAIEA